MNRSERIAELVDELNGLGLPLMALSLEELCRNGAIDDLDGISLAERIVGPEYEQRSSLLYRNRLRRAKLAGCPSRIDLCRDGSGRSYLPVGITETLGTLDFVRDGLNVCVLGPSDSGKTYLAKALAVQACRSYRALYTHCSDLLESMAVQKDSDFAKYRKRIRFLVKLDLLVLDDFLLNTVADETEVKVLFEVLEKRSEAQRSTVVCSQRDPSSWSSMIMNDPVTADAILKRATRHYTVVIRPQD